MRFSTAIDELFSLQVTTGSMSILLLLISTLLILLCCCYMCSYVLMQSYKRKRSNDEFGMMLRDAYKSHNTTMDELDGPYHTANFTLTMSGEDNGGFEAEKSSIRKREPTFRETLDDDFAETRIDVGEPDEKVRFSFRKLWKFTGPGFLMSIAYLDPGNIESDLQSGAIAQYKLIWVLLMAHILGLLMQRLSARIGVVSGQHMAQIAHSYYTKIPRVCLWIMVQIAIIGSDMQEVIGTAISLYLLSNGNIPLWVGVLITICDTFSFLFLERYGIRYFELFFCFLISCMAASFGFEFVKAAPDAAGLFKGMVIPWCKDCRSDQLLQGISLLGAVIMPHNFYLHSALVQSRRVNREKRSAVKEANFYYFIESAFALLCSFIINVLVVAVFAMGLYGKTNQQVRDMCETNDNGMPQFYRDVYKNDTDDAESDIYHAGIYLGCAFGTGALYVWAIGILAAGQSSTMTGTYAGQFAMEGFIKLEMPAWKRLLLTRSIAILPTLAVTIFSGGIQHITGLNDFLNCVQMLQLPFALIPLLTFVADSKIMGEFACSTLQKWFALLVSLVVLFINIYFLYEWVGDEFGWTPASLSTLAVLFVIYGVLIVYLTYYCLVAMGAISPIESKYFPTPKYQNFDAPWLESIKSEIEDYTLSARCANELVMIESAFMHLYDAPTGQKTYSMLSVFEQSLNLFFTVYDAVHNDSDCAYEWAPLFPHIIEFIKGTERVLNV
ncbi:unnamed protein product, partial [Mesorhabditis belari]|uniref:Uncharacterized protein n=1 Tax=Mesorhabditis belari TaxID=2138241 RepID=A0AAF3E7Y0_9BILA